MSKYARPLLTGLLLAAMSVAVASAEPTTAATPRPVRQLADNHSPAHGVMTPATTCSGNTCDGKDPVAAGCTNGAVVYASASTTVGSTVETINVYYSPACSAGYGQFVDPNYQNETNNPPVLGTFYLPQFGGPEQPLGEGSGSGDTVYSTMIHWDVSIKACYLTKSAAAPYDPAPDVVVVGTSGFCTRWT